MATKICDRQITTSVTNEAQTVTGTSAFSGFGKIGGLSLLAQFTYGSGGTSAKAYVQTSFDGVNWWDIACFAFTTASANRNANIDGFAQVTTATPATGVLADNTVAHGLIGDRFRTVLTTTGTYAGNTQLVVYMQER